VKRTTITVIESTLFGAVGAAGMVEGLRLSADRTDLYQMMGPGAYISGLSLALMLIGAIHLIVNMRRSVGVERVPVSRIERTRMVSIVVLLCANIFLIELAGYAVALVIFFLAVFRILEVKSWRTNIILSLSLAAVYYVVFVKFCDVIFPPGILFS